MDSIHQQRFRPLIEERIQEIEQELQSGKAATSAVAPDKAIGRLSRLDSMQMQQMALASSRRLKEETQQLRQALARIDQGNFGRCALCGQDIPDERLEYQPAAVCCVGCLEKRR